LKTAEKSYLVTTEKWTAVLPAPTGDDLMQSALGSFHSVSTLL